MRIPPARCVLSSLLFVASTFAASQLAAEGGAPTPERAPDPAPVTQPRQVILIIGDGMDEQQITIARDYRI